MIQRSVDKMRCLIENVASFLENFLIFLPTLLFLALFLFVWFFGRKKAAAHLEEIDEIIREVMAPYATSIDGPINLKPDVYEFRCKPKNPHIGVLTINVTTLNQTMFPNPYLNRLFKSNEKLFIGLKFRTEGRDINPVYRFHLIPYRKKMEIRKNFDTYVALDDIQTASKTVDNHFMVKSGSELELEHIASDEKLMKLIENNEKGIESIHIQKAKEKTDPHFQATFKFRPNELYKIEDYLNIFFRIAQLHIDNHDSIKKMITQRKTRNVVKKTKSAKSRGKKKDNKKIKKKKN